MTKYNHIFGYFIYSKIWLKTVTEKNVLFSLNLNSYNTWLMTNSQDALNQYLFSGLTAKKIYVKTHDWLKPKIKERQFYATQI